jgi:hypothetical protein
MSQRLTLNQADFAKLVRGEIVTQGDLQCALQDIGHAQMFNALVDALTEELRLAVTGGDVPVAVGSSFREDEEEVRRWIYGLTHGEPSAPGGFLEAFCNTVRRADDGNYALLRPTILALKAKYPKYRFTGAL